MKRLIICCDGTWQRLYGGALTNVALSLQGAAYSTAQRVRFNLSTQAMTVESGAPTYGIENYGNNVYRIWMTATTTTRTLIHFSKLLHFFYHNIIIFFLRHCFPF